MMNVLTRVLAMLRIIATVSLLFMMLVTIVDVTMRSALNELVLGTVELVQLALVATVFLALPETLLRGEHITVDVIDHALSHTALRRLRRTAALATLLLAAVLAWRAIPPALDTITIGDLTTDLGISLFWYWLPLIIGAVAGAAAALAYVVGEFQARSEEE
ncbi:TRAP transporter small permease [Candidatus Rariloculus sp.]|uniref:TRAP transporter small permease n=1 Tax=Candidatus Rariloculus sp. TaxID=3101265 RepID=UPI003D0BEE5C